LSVAPVDSTGENMFLAKFDSAGAIAWAFGTGKGSGASVDVEENGNVTVAGWFRGTADFDPGPGIANLLSSPAIYANCVIARYSSAGMYDFAFGVPGTPSRGFAVTLDGSGKIYCTGYYGPWGGSSYFDPNSTTDSLTSLGEYDLFFARYAPTVPAPKRSVRDTRFGTEAPSLHAAPNPFTGEFALRFDGVSAPARLQISDLTGEVLLARDVDDASGEIILGSELPAGAYLVQIIQGTGRRSSLVYKVR
jgi:hypothetical protein